MLRRLDRLKGTKILFKYGEARSIGCGEDSFFRFYSKWLLWKPATPFWGFNLKHWQHWRQQFLLFDKTRFDFQTSTSCKFLFRSGEWTKVLTVNCCFQCFLQALSGNNLFATNSVDEFSCATCQMSNVMIILGHFNRTLLVFDYSEFQEISL